MDWHDIILSIFTICIIFYQLLNYLVNYKKKTVVQHTGIIVVPARELYNMPDVYINFAIASTKDLLLSLGINKNQTMESVNDVISAKFVYYLINNQIAGMLRYYDACDHAPTYEEIQYTAANNSIFITNVYVAEKFRKQGVARALISSMLNVDSIYSLMVLKNNKPALKLYKSLGFKKIDSVCVDRAWLMLLRTDR